VSVEVPCRRDDRRRAPLDELACVGVAGASGWGTVFDLLLRDDLGSDGEPAVAADGGSGGGGWDADAADACSTSLAASAPGRPAELAMAASALDRPWAREPRGRSGRLMRGRR
jgi:hypothetical protein